MEIKDYKQGDIVEVLMSNPRNENLMEWREAEVLDKRVVHPDNGSRHRPYPILIVRVQRTYCRAEPVYNFVNGNIPVFVDNSLEFYDKLNDEGIIYPNQIRLKS
jgi:hypothetical protein